MGVGELNTMAINEALISGVRVSLRAVNKKLGTGEKPVTCQKEIDGEPTHAQLKLNYQGR